MEELITQIRIKNFKCYDDIVVPLRKFTVIVGQNSSGKSTIFQALDVLRLAVDQLHDKKDNLMDHSMGGISFSKKMKESLRRLPWYRGGLRSWARDADKPVGVGITFRVGNASTEGVPAVKRYMSIDVELGSSWNPAHGGARGAGLPACIRFGFYQWSGSPNEPLEVPSILLVVHSSQADAAKGHRQSAVLTLSASYVTHLQSVLATSGEEFGPIPMVQELAWGPCPFFQKIVSQGGREANGTPSFNANLRKLINQEINSGLDHCWTLLKTKLSPSTLLSEGMADAVHIRADDNYMVQENPADKNTLESLFENLKGEKSEAFQDFRLQNIRPETEARVTQIAQDLLELPYEISVADNEVVLKDLRGCGHGTNGGHIPLALAGYGLQKMIPRLLVYVQQNPKFCVLEEPGTNAHPRLQGLLARALTLMMKDSGDGAQMVCETHSENFIRMTMNLVKSGGEGNMQSTLASEDILFLYIDYPKGEPQPKIMYMRLDAEGELADPWPNGFFMERELIQRGRL